MDSNALSILGRIQSQLRAAQEQKEKTEQRSRLSKKTEQRLGPNLATDEEALIPVLFPTLRGEFRNVVDAEPGEKRRSVDKGRRAVILARTLTFWGQKNASRTPTEMNTERLEQVMGKMFGRDARGQMRGIREGLGEFLGAKDSGSINDDDPFQVGGFLVQAMAERAIEKLTDLIKEAGLTTQEVRRLIPVQVLIECQAIDMNLDRIDGIEYIDTRDLRQSDEVHNVGTQHREGKEQRRR